MQAFNATKDFENHALIAFLESIGAEFGACSNAYTSADETVCTLTRVSRLNYALHADNDNN